MAARRLGRAWLPIAWMLVMPLAWGSQGAEADASAQPPALLQPDGITTPEQAERALAEASAARETAQVERRIALADCAGRVFSNRCAAQAEQTYRALDDRLRQTEARAREVLREARNRDRYDALAQREREAAERVQRARDAEQSARDRAARREADQAVRERAAAERELAAAARAARQEGRRQAREREDARRAPAQPR